jgi:uncharacterized protein (TIGR03085 family)
MADYLALRERLALCDLALALGPDAPTLCEGWDARDLVSHLLIRERRPITALGNVVPPLAGLTERAMAAHRTRSYEVLVERLRTPSPPLRAVPLLDRLMNTIEMVVHHEDLRRGQADWRPRALPAGDLDLLWSQLVRTAPMIGRRLPVPAELRRADTGDTAVVREGSGGVTVSGPVVELLLFLVGRSAVRDVSFDGPDDAIDTVRSADLAV